MERQLVKDAFGKLKEDWERVRQLQAKFILKRYKNLLRKYFDEFYKQTIILKIEKEKFEQKMELQRQERNEKVAQDYREYTLYKKAITAWRFHHSKEREQKQKAMASERAEENS